MEEWIFLTQEVILCTGVNFFLHSDLQKGVKFFYVQKWFTCRSDVYPRVDLINKQRRFIRRSEFIYTQEWFVGRSD